MDNRRRVNLKSALENDASCPMLTLLKLMPELWDNEEDALIDTTAFEVTQVLPMLSRYQDDFYIHGVARPAEA